MLRLLVDNATSKCNVADRFDLFTFVRACLQLDAIEGDVRSVVE